MPSTLPTGGGMNVTNRQVSQAAVGLQALLAITEVPSAAEGGLINRPLTEVTLSVAGDYYCDIYIGGLGAIEVYMKPQLTGSAAVTSTVYTTRKDKVTVFQGFASDGAQADNTDQTATLAARKGEQWARVKLAVSGAGTVTYDFAECNGQ